MSAQVPQEIKDKLNSLAGSYQTGVLNFDDYKIQAVTVLGQWRDQAWLEQFLYRETGNFFTAAEKFTLTDHQPMKRGQEKIIPGLKKIG
jgi:hypothetical protein